MNEIIARLEQLNADSLRLHPKHRPDLSQRRLALGYSCCVTANVHLAQALASLRKAKEWFYIEED